MAGGIAGAAATSLVTGQDFGDTLMSQLPSIIGNTIGNLVADGISLRASAHAEAKSFAEKAAELNGLKPGTQEYQDFIRQNRGTIDQLGDDIERIQRSGDGSRLISVRDEYAEKLLTVDSGTYENAQNRLAPLDSNIVVYGGERTPAIHSLIDPIDMEAGNLAIRVSTMANEAIDSVPGGRLAVGLLDLGLTIAGGPARAALGAVMGEANEAATSYLTERFTSVGYVERDAQAGGVGGPFLLTIATNGVGGALAMGGIFGGIRNAHLAGGNHPKTDVPFDVDGFPDFSAHATHTVTINQTGRRGVDERLANAAAGLRATPKGYTWHHHQDGTTMQLIPRNLHRETGHTGGVGLRNKP